MTNETKIQNALTEPSDIVAIFEIMETNQWQWDQRGNTFEIIPKPAIHDGDEVIPRYALFEQFADQPWICSFHLLGGEWIGSVEGFKESRHTDVRVAAYNLIETIFEC